MILRYCLIFLLLTVPPLAGCGASTRKEAANDRSAEPPSVPTRPPGLPTEYYSSGLGGSLPLRADLSTARIEAQFVPDHASVVSRSASELVLQFSDEMNTTFSISKTFSFPGGEIKGTFARFPDADAAGKFISLLDILNIRDGYLVKNELFEEETFVHSRLLAPSAPLQVTSIDISQANALVPEIGSVTLVADQHGYQSVYDALLAILEKPEIDWFGIEMLDHRLQDDLDTFLTAPAGSSEAAAARAKLLAYYSHAWNAKFPDTGAENNHYFRLIERAKHRGIRVYAMDASAEYQLFRGDEGNLALAARSYFWSKNIPADGTGVVFGGADHVTYLPGNSLQDYIDLQQTRMILIVK